MLGYPGGEIHRCTQRGQQTPEGQIGPAVGQVEEGIRCFQDFSSLYSSADDTVSRSGQIDTEPPRINHFYEQKLFLGNFRKFI